MTYLRTDKGQYPEVACPLLSPHPRFPVANIPPLVLWGLHFSLEVPFQL